MREGQKRDFARGLRTRMTDAERLLWFHLRNRALMGCKFRRQHPVGPYVADFACLEPRIIVELDGSQHVAATGDALRTSFLESAGYRVLRFWNNDALLQVDAVLAAILVAVTSRRPHSTPPRSA